MCTSKHFGHQEHPPVTGESGTQQLYQPKPRLAVYIVPITSILGRLALIPVGDHITIPSAMRNHKKELFPYGRFDKGMI